MLSKKDQLGALLLILEDIIETVGVFMFSIIYQRDRLEYTDASRHSRALAMGV